MLFKSQVYTQASGSVGGLTYSHNRGGMYTRSRTIPTDPASSYQVARRTRMSVLSNHWTNELSAAERLAWDVYAANVTVINRLGDSIYLSGQQQFVRANMPRDLAGLSIVEAAPTTFDLGSFTTPTLAAATDAPEASITFTNTDDWAIAVGGALLVYASRPQNASINYFRGPYRFMDRVLGAVVPPTSPDAMTPPFTLTQGQRLFARARIIQVDGRLSANIDLGSVLVTPAA